MPRVSPWRIRAGNGAENWAQKRWLSFQQDCLKRWTCREHLPRRKASKPRGGALLRGAKIASRSRLRTAQPLQARKRKSVRARSRKTTQLAARVRRRHHTVASNSFARVRRAHTYYVYGVVILVRDDWDEAVPPLNLFQCRCAV
ncbi:hypothetical protein PUNSTDRAFT_51781 [Punctularia strigosozonata HHB-11173 SS5]|uniref:uncharacterized protein n=1 Tax=Punctularia strigosozonata (strain HHB-11173) TaxID=741275 RepID=UPI0004417AA9|nr:uncharacterized protein PUNSTDRAFT_51781 [Punctularia strigosozonata HHB-11173 SS5]EIN09542.1 hypothetical protein PUNSTDRAFT_51781 [Punctularia strigosozonata HHB-11173 SS5]